MSTTGSGSAVVATTHATQAPIDPVRAWIVSLGGIVVGADTMLVTYDVARLNELDNRIKVADALGHLETRLHAARALLEAPPRP